MTGPIAKAEKIAARHAAALQRLQTEIAARETSGRETVALARARAALPSAERRAHASAARVAELAQAAAAKAARAKATDAPMIRLLDKIAAAAPALMDRWKKDRAEEPKRIAKRKKHLKRATTMDLRPETSIRRDRPAPMVEATTFPSGPIIPYVPPKMDGPERPGLLPGDYRLIERGADDFDAYNVPKKWTADYVGRRLADAHATLRRLPMTTRPKEFGAIWPEYTAQAGELAIQAGAGTLTLGRNRIVGGISAMDVARMHKAFGWVLTYLSGDTEGARELNRWAYADAADSEDQEPFEHAAELAAQKIADGLSADGIKVE